MGRVPRLPSRGYKERPLPDGACRDCWGSGFVLTTSWGRNGDQNWPSDRPCQVCNGAGKAEVIPVIAPTTPQVLLADHQDAHKDWVKASMGDCTTAQRLANLQRELSLLGSAHLRALAASEADRDRAELAELKAVAHNLRYCPENYRRKHLDELDTLIERMEGQGE